MTYFLYKIIANKHVLFNIIHFSHTLTIFFSMNQNTNKRQYYIAGQIKLCKCRSNWPA